MAERVFPEGARLLEMPSGEGELGVWRMLVSWKLGTDPTRPHKRSKTVRIIVGSEALEDFTRSPFGAREAANGRFERWLRTELERFDPNHETPNGVEPPVVPWQIGTVELNG